MPMFEGISYTGDKNVVIIDIGYAYTKCGVAGETCPRCIVPSVLRNEQIGKVRQILEYNSEEELFENLKDFLFILYYRHLLINPKDRRLVICESLLCPEMFRKTLAKVLFKHFEVASVMFAPGQLTSLLTLGCNTSLVLDVGYKEALVVPVYAGIPILKALQSHPTGGEAIHKRIKEMLLAKGKLKEGTIEKRISDHPDCLTAEVLEDIKVRCCFVTKIDRAKKIHDVTMRGADESTLPFPPPSVEYPVDGSSVMFVDGNVREQACEVMFEQDNEQKSIATLLLDAILQCPIDMRVELSQNLLITGGTTMIPGFLHRVQVELKNLLEQPKYTNAFAIKKFRFHQPPCKANYTAWLGGAMYGALETLPSRSVSRDTYNETGTLTDWCSLSTKIVNQSKAG